MWIDILWYYDTVDILRVHNVDFPTLWGYDVCRKIRQHYEESRTVAWISNKDIQAAYPQR